MEADLIKQNPALKEPCMVLLQLASEISDELELIERAEETWSATYPQAPATILEILVRHGALASQTLVNGEPYEGTLEDMQLDETVPDDAEVQIHVELTDEGRALYDAHEPHHTIAQLLAERPQYERIFTALLTGCGSETGLLRSDVESIITHHPDFAHINEGGTRIYPQYFIDALETAGGIAWDTTWHTTEAGMALLQK